MLDSEYAKMILKIIPPTMRFIRNEMRLAAKSELTVPQFRILARLARSPGTNREIADWMGVSAPTMSRMLDPLVKKKWVDRIPQPTDRRQVTLRITKAGQSTYDRIYKIVHTNFTKKVASLSSDKKNSLANGLCTLSEMFL